jgi:hypothetical protein
VIAKRNRIREVLLEIIRVLILAGVDDRVRDNKGRLPVDSLLTRDSQRRAIYEEAVEEVDSRGLKV